MIILLKLLYIWNLNDLFEENYSHYDLNPISTSYTSKHLIYPSRFKKHAEFDSKWCMDFENSIFEKYKDFTDATHPTSQIEPKIEYIKKPKLSPVDTYSYGEFTVDVFEEYQTSGLPIVLGTLPNHCFITAQHMIHSIYKDIAIFTMDCKHQFLGFAILE